MEKQPGQFGILALLVLMTASAIGFAVVRLPVPLELKLCVVFAIGVCFFGWAVRNRKYPDPRQVPAAPVRPAWRRAGLVVQMVYPLALAVALIGPQVRFPPRLSAADIVMWVTIPLLIGVSLWRLVREW